MLVIRQGKTTFKVIEKYRYGLWKLYQNALIPLSENECCKEKREIWFWLHTTVASVKRAESYSTIICKKRERKDHSLIFVNKGSDPWLEVTKSIDLFEIVHPNLDLVLLKRFIVQYTKHVFLQVSVCYF